MIPASLEFIAQLAFNGFRMNTQLHFAGCSAAQICVHGIDIHGRDKARPKPGSGIHNHLGKPPTSQTFFSLAPSPPKGLFTRKLQ